MMTNPEWLPETLDYTGNWDAFLNEAYEIFTRDLKCSPRPEYEGYPVLHDSRLGDSDKEEGFWHVITKTDPATQERLPDLDRAKKIIWIRPLIENCGDPAVTVFDFEESNRAVRTYIWLKSCDFVVILEKKKTVAFLVTAFHINYNSTRRKLQRKFENRL